MSARTATDYVKLLKSLIPSGRAWPKEEGSILHQFLYSVSLELARIEARALELAVERNTNTVNELIEDYERDLGLPDECTESGDTIQERRAAVHAQLLARGRINKAYYIEIAHAYGFAITITEYTPFMCGSSECGSPCGDYDVMFRWTVNVDPGVTPIWFQCGSGQCEDPIQKLAYITSIWFQCGNSQCGDSIQKLADFDPVGCLIRELKPAHTTVDFNVI